MEMSSFRLPCQLVFDNNIADNWKKFKQRFELFVDATCEASATDKKKIGILLNAIGDEGLDVYNNFEYVEGEDKNKVATILNKFDEYCSPKRNVVFHR